MWMVDITLQASRFNFSCFNNAAFTSLISRKEKVAVTTVFKFKFFSQGFRGVGGIPQFEVGAIDF